MSTEPAAGDLPEAEIVENVVPTGGLYQPKEAEKGKEPTRRKLAYSLAFILAILVLVGCWGWLTDGDDNDKMQNFGLIFAPVVTLVGTVLGFYFSSDDK